MKPLLMPVSASPCIEKKEPTWKSLVGKILSDMKLEVDMTICMIVSYFDSLERNRSKFSNFDEAMALLTSHVFVGQ